MHNNHRGEVSWATFKSMGRKVRTLDFVARMIEGPLDHTWKLKVVTIKGVQQTPTGDSIDVRNWPLSSAILNQISQMRVKSKRLERALLETLSVRALGSSGRRTVRCVIKQLFNAVSDLIDIDFRSSKRGELKNTLANLDVIGACRTADDE
jgi:hypothetical protein